MSSEPWSEPTWTVDQVRKLGRRIRSLARTNKFASFVSTVLFSVLMLELVILLYTSFYPMFIGGMALITLPEWFYSTLLVTFMISIVVYAVAGTFNDRLNRLLQVYQKVGIVVKMQCASCSRLSERTWQKGDYIFKDEGVCACGGPTFISQMYLMPLPIKKPLDK
jgi:hypothetical protein